MSNTGTQNRRIVLLCAAVAAAFALGEAIGGPRERALADAPAAAPIRSQIIDLHSYRPAGNGLTDDTSLIQAAVNATPSGGTLMFEAGRRYAISRAIDCRGKTIHIEGHGSTVVTSTSNYPNNTAFHFGALLAGGAGIGRTYNSQQPPPPGSTFSGPIMVGENAFAASLPAGIPVGSYVSANFGTCPSDKTLPDVSYIAKVIGNSNGTVTLDAPIPREVHGNTHSFYGVLSLGDNCSISNVGFDWSSGVTPDVQISVDYCRNFRAENLFGRFSSAVNATYARDVEIDGVNGSVEVTSPAAGRVFGGWLLEGFSVRNVLVNQSKNARVFFFEGRAREGLIDNVILNSTVGPVAWEYGVVCLDGAQNILVRGLTINAGRGERVTLATDGTSNGSNHSGLTFENLRTNAPLAYADMREIKSGFINNIELGEPMLLHYSVPITGRSGRILHLARGAIRRLSVRAPEHVTQINFRQNFAGPTLTSVKPGEWQTMANGFSNDQWNDPTKADIADCAVLDDGHLASDAKIEVLVDVFPCGQDVRGE